MAPQATAEVELGAAIPQGGEQVAAPAERSHGTRKGAAPVPGYSTETRLTESEFPGVEILQ